VRKIGFTVKGVPPELRVTFSKRRQEILRQAAETGATSQDELQNITLRSRANKTNATAATLREKWRTECGPHLEALRAVIASAQSAPPPLHALGAADAVRSAEAHVFERKSVVDNRVLLREALVAGRGQVTLAGLKRAVAARELTGELIRSGEEIASRDSLKAEEEFTGWANSQLKACGAMGKAPATKGLGTDQAQAVADLLAARSRVVVLQGDAGTGKTTCLKTIVASIEQAGGRVFGCAPSAGATDVLRKELTAEADTLQQLLVNESLQRTMKGRVLLVDEAGLVSVREMRDLCRLAARHDNRLLLVGDTKQHTSVEAGDALRCLQEFASVPLFRLTEIRRQKDPVHRKAVAMLARGDAFGAFNEFHRLGAVREFREPARLWSAAAADYVQTVRAGKSCLAISPVWEEIHAFTRVVRQHLQAAKLVATEERPVLTVSPLGWTREERRRIAAYQPDDVLTFHRDFGPFAKYDAVAVLRREDRLLVVRDVTGIERRFDPRRASGFDVGLAKEIPVAVGDRLLIRANLKPAGLRNGDLVEVAGFGGDGAIRFRDGRSLPAWFRDFSHGYAMTSHAAQGKTVDRGLLLMADEGIAAGNLKQAYVSNSRFRESQMIYVSDKQAARDAMMRPADRKLALELTGPALPSSDDDAHPPAARARIRAPFAPTAPAISPT
jgi:hypothetical protein